MGALASITVVARVVPLAVIAVGIVVPFIAIAVLAHVAG